MIVGKDYPHPDGLDYVRRKWKEALRDPQNCQLIPNDNNDVDVAKENERIIRKAVGKGRYVIREMEGTIQLKKYRTMRRRYGQVSVVLCTECFYERMCDKLYLSNTNHCSIYLTMSLQQGVDVTGEARRINDSLNDLIKRVK